MNERIQKLKATVGPGSYEICSEKGMLATESFKQTERQPEIIRNAKALAHILDNVTIFIQDGELIVGNAASKKRGIEFTDFYGTWTDADVENIKAGEGFTISEQTEADLRAMKEYWKGKTWIARVFERLDQERLWPYLETGVTLPPLTTREEEKAGAVAANGWGIQIEYASLLFIPDYAKILYGGCEKIIEEAEQELNNTKLFGHEAIEKSDFLRAVIIAHKAIIRFAGRFAALATEMSSKEKDPARKKELDQIARNCRRVPAKPARTFYEAMQSFWFLYVVMNPNNVLSYGRFDQLMYPFYKKDIEEGKLTREGALELLELLRIKDMETIHTASKGVRDKWSGLAKWHNMIIGGQTPEGKDAVNDLSYLILEAAKDCPTPHHTLTVRVHEKTPEAFMIKALEVVKTGIGMPAFVGDKGHIEFLLSNGIPLRIARDYGLAGCLDVNLCGLSRNVSYTMFVIPRVFDIFMHNGVDPKTGKQVGPRTGALEDFRSFDELLKAFKEQLRFWMGRHAEWNNLMMGAQGELYPAPVESSLMVGGVEAGKSFLNRRVLFENSCILNAVGMINVVDSLAATKKLVYDENKIAMKDLKAALDANWQGNGYPEMRKMFLAAPKYGNNDDFVDGIATDMYGFWADTAVTFDGLLGAKQVPSAISISAQGPGGEETGATPDGRYAGQCLADGTTSAMRGMDVSGPTSLILSASKIDQIPISTTLMNVKFHPSALKSTEDLRQLSNLIRTYFSLGGKHIQFNVVNSDTLMQAQEDPESHKDLIVRVAGYSAYFVQLSRAIQDEVIGRTEHEKVA